METYGIMKQTFYNGMVSYSKLSSGYEIEKARLRCRELNRIQEPKNNHRLSIKYYIRADGE